MLPDASTMKNIAKRGKAYFQNKIDSNKVSGTALTPRTIRNKIYRGSPTPAIKLKEGGGLRDQMKTDKTTAQKAEIGYYDDTHNKVKSYDADISVASLAKIHDEGIGSVPERKILELDEEFIDIVADEIAKRMEGR